MRFVQVPPPDSLQVANPGSEPSTGALLWAGGSMVGVRSQDRFLWIDPFFGEAANPKITRRSPPVLGPADVVADLVLITHEHRDHCDPQAIRAIARDERTLILAPEESVKQLSTTDFGRLRTVRPGDRVEESGFAVSVLDSEDSYSAGAVSYLVETPHVSVAHFGDSGYATHVFRQVENRSVTFAFLNFGDALFDNKVYLNKKELELAAEDTGADVIVPIHWDLWVESYVNALDIDWTHDRIQAVLPGTAFLADGTA